MNRFNTPNINIDPYNALSRIDKEIAEYNSTKSERPIQPEADKAYILGLSNAKQHILNETKSQRHLTTMRSHNSKIQADRCISSLKSLLRTIKQPQS